MNGLLGKKVGMTQVFDEQGRKSTVTVLEVGPCVAVQVKTPETDGYSAVQLGFEAQKKQRLTKPALGHLAKAGVDPVRELREFAPDADETVEPGATFDVTLFEGIGYVDVVGTCKGRGFQGVMRRHGFGGGRATHGSGTHRGPGSIGMKEWPARVFKGKKMPGHMGNTRTTVQNLRVVAVRPEDHVLLVEGAVPGPVGGLVEVRKAIKKAAKAS
jgi:large subunit ribosomal protein L3